MPNYSLIQATPRVPDGISCRYFLVDPSQAGRRTLLVVAFEGEYPDGSRGNAHGAYIATSAIHGLHAFDADGVVLDVAVAVILTRRAGVKLTRLG